MNLNKVFLIGRLTQNPETRNLPSGQLVCNFGLATNRIWTSQQTKEKQEKAEFHNIVLFGRLAEIASQYLSKGGLALIEGRIQTRSWQDQSGSKRYKTEVVAENIQLGPRTFSASSNNNADARTEKPKIEQEKIPETNIPVIEETASLASNKEEGDEEIDIKDIPF